MSNSQKITSKGLPVVTQTALDALWETYTTSSGEKWGTRLTEVQKRLISEQPALVKFIESQVNKYPHEFHVAILEVVVATIAVLEDSAEANQISSKYKIT